MLPPFMVPHFISPSGAGGQLIQLLPLQAAQGMGGSAQLDAQVEAAFGRSQAADLIRRLFDYLSANLEKHEQLSPAVDLLKHAAEAFKAQNYAGAYEIGFQVYRFVSLLRLQVPDLPPVDAGAQTQQAGRADDVRP
jgi:hypothetical protein